MKGKIIVLSALYDSRLRQKAIEKEQNILLNKNKILFEEAADISGEELSKKILNDLESDKTHLKKFNTQIANYEDKSRLYEDVKTHKMEEIFIGVGEIFSDNENITKIANGKLPSGYNNEITSLPMAKGDYYGTSKTSFISAALLSTYFTLTNKTIDNIDFFNSAITHVAPLPNDLSLNEHFRYCYSKNIKGFGYVHSSYSFGGYRYQDSLYPQGKFLAPEDCSSWIGKITTTSGLGSTSDLYCTYLKNSSNIYKPAASLTNTPFTKELIDKFIPVNINDIEPGDIYVRREFKNASHELNDLGEKGHTVICIDKPNANQILTIGANRDMPETEGVCLETFPLNYKSDEEICFLRLKEEFLEKVPNYNLLKDLEYSNQGDIHLVIDYFDNHINGKLMEWEGGLY